MSAFDMAIIVLKWAKQDAEPSGAEKLGAAIVRLIKNSGRGK